MANDTFIISFISFIVIAAAIMVLIVVISGKTEAGQ